MKALLDPVRSVLRPEYRQQVYNLVGVAVVVLGGYGVVDNNTASTVAQLVLALTALLFAVLYSTSELRVALYGTLVAVQAVAALWSIGNDATWAGIVSIAAAVLGTQVASGRTPIPMRFTDEFDRSHSALGGDWPEGTQ